MEKKISSERAVPNERHVKTPEFDAWRTLKEFVEQDFNTFKGRLIGGEMADVLNLSLGLCRRVSRKEKNGSDKSRWVSTVADIRCWETASRGRHRLWIFFLYHLLLLRRRRVFSKLRDCEDCRQLVC